MKVLILITFLGVCLTLVGFIIYGLGETYGYMLGVGLFIGQDIIRWTTMYNDCYFSNQTRLRICHVV